MKTTVEKTNKAVLENAVEGISRQFLDDAEFITGDRISAGKILPLKVVMDYLEFEERNLRQIDAGIICQGSLKFDQVRNPFRWMVLRIGLHLRKEDFRIREHGENVQNRQTCRKLLGKIYRLLDLVFCFVRKADNECCLNSHPNFHAVIDRGLCQADICSLFDFFDHLGTSGLNTEENPSAPGLVHIVNILRLQYAEPHLASPDKIQTAVYNQIQKPVADGSVRNELFVGKIDSVCAALLDKVFNIMDDMLRLSAAVPALMKLFVGAKCARSGATLGGVQIKHFGAVEEGRKVSLRVHQCPVQLRKFR